MIRQSTFAIALATCICACDGRGPATAFVPVDASEVSLSDAVSPGPDGFAAPDVLPDPCLTGPVAGEPCLYRTCDSGCVCVTTQIVDGTACDGGACIVGPGACSAGACVGAAVDCDDGEPCTDDGCDLEMGCVHDPRPLSTRCDVDPCRIEACSANGTCRALTSAANPGTPCGDDEHCTAAGQCRRADTFSLGLFGDGCVLAGDCVSGRCAGNVCSYVCAIGGADCASGWLCGAGSMCRPSDYGAACDDDADCSARCAPPSGGAPAFCTAACESWSCPTGWVCQTVPELTKQTGIGYCVEAAAP